MSEKKFEESTSVGDVLFAPLYLPEYLIRGITWPLGQFVEFAERVHLPARAKDFFSNEDHTIWLYPIISYSSSDGAAFAAHFKHKELFAGQNSLKLDAVAKVFTNSDSEVGLSLKNNNKWKGFKFKLSAKYEDDSNKDFFGIGQGAENADKSFYALRRSSVQAEFRREVDWCEYTLLKGLLGYHRDKTSTSGDSPLAEVNSPEILAQGFGKELDFFSYGLDWSWSDSFPKGHPYRGSTFALRFENFIPLSDKDFGFNQIDFKYRKYINIYNKDRVLVLGLHHRAVSENGDREIPFQNLAFLGKKTLLRGFDSQRFTDKKFVVGNLEYRFPMWETLHPRSMYGLAKLFFDVGKTFNRFNEFDEQDWQYSGGVGMSLTTTHHFFFDFEVGYGGEGVELIASLGRRL